MTKPVRLTPKQRVLKRYPAAYVCQVVCLGVVVYEILVPQTFDNYPTKLSYANSERTAWAAAARRLRGQDG